MNKPDGEFTSIRVSTLRGDLKIPFDAYVRVGEKYIHYCRKGDSFEGQRLERLRSKQLKVMFIREEEMIAYRSYLDANLDAAFDTNRALNLRVEIMQGAQMANAEDVMDDPIDKFIYSQCKRSAARFLEFLKLEPFAPGMLIAIPNPSQGISQHSVNVATLAISIALKNPPREGLPLDLMALGCLLHDIEEYHEPGLNVNKPVAQMTPAELALYRQHPIAGAHRFQGASHVDQLVTSIVAQHEEEATGGGFPQKLTEENLDPLVLIAATANAYDRLVTFESMEPKKALKTLLIEKLGAYPLPILQALQSVLKTQGTV